MGDQRIHFIDRLPYDTIVEEKMRTSFTLSMTVSYAQRRVTFQ